MKYLAKTTFQMEIDTDTPGFQSFLHKQTRLIRADTLIEKYVRFLCKGSLLNDNRWEIEERS